MILAPRDYTLSLRDSQKKGVCMSTSIKRICNELNVELPTSGVIKSVGYSSISRLICIAISTDRGIVYKSVQSTVLKVGQHVTFTWYHNLYTSMVDAITVIR
jgi:hypothetical protein